SGKAELTVDLRRDNNWQRASVAEEELRFSSNATLEIKDDRILGVKFSELDIDSIAQDVTGTLSLVDQRTPWLIADLQSDNLNLDGLLDFIPASTEQTEQNDLLSTLKDLGELRISLNAKSLTLMELPLSNMQLEVSSIKNVFSVDKLDFTAEDSQLSSRGDIRWSGRKAGFKASVNVTDFDLDRFLIADLNATQVPVSGSAELASEGHKLTELLANLTGQINLQASQQQTTPSIKARRNLIMTVKRLPDGLHADINTFELGSNELSGSVRYHKTSPPQLDIEIVDGTLSIVPWQESHARQQQKPPTKDDTGTAISGAARASANFVGNMVLAPARFFSGPAEAAPGEKYLSAEPLPLDKLKSSNAKINGKLASITSNEGVIKDLTFSGTLDHGKLSLQAKTGYINQGSGELEATLDTNVTPPSAQLTVSFSELKGAPDAKTYPSSGFTYLASQGQSPAELAANLNGTMYLKLGKGPIDYQRFTLLNADVASSMFRTLIPGLDKKEPEIQCGVTLITFKDGMGITPYGFAARTNSANLIGRLAIDLKKEMMELQFDSRSREGVGISVGSVFSNTVQIKGPLTDPEIVPNTTSIIWRGAAAFMTAGLSVVGESVFKRALASSNPCKAINKDIRKDICKTSLPAASSPLVCPTSPAG
ncbi:MAG: AsmA-like C-terminal region-containing protein, partial [Halioglobus sp.]